MTTSAKRLGLEVDSLELELRLRRIEVELDKRALANVDAAETSRGRSAPPRITGFSVRGQTPGSITMGWNPSPIADLRRYQIQFAEDAGFSTNLQTFNVRDTLYQFSTAGSPEGTAFFTRVRVQNSIGQFSVYSVVINTATGEAVGTDSVDTAAVQDDAITGDKIDPDSVADALTLPGPNFLAADSNKFVRINTAADSYEAFAGTLPTLAAAGDAGKLIRVAGSNSLAYTSYTFPSTASAGKLLRGTGANWVETGFTFPSAALDDRVLIGDGTNYVLFDQSITDDAATDSGAGAANRSGKIAIAPGLTLEWDTIEVAEATDVDVIGLDDQVVSVVACSASLTVTSSLSPGVAAWVLSDTSIRLHQENSDSEAVDVTYYVLSNTLIP